MLFNINGLALFTLSLLGTFSASFLLPEKILMLASLFFLLTFGMFHGGYDIVILDQMNMKLSNRLISYFLYLSLAILVLLLAWQLPLIFFIFFIVESVFHFGSGDTLPTKNKCFETLFRGLLPFTLTAFFYPEEVVFYYSLLSQSLKNAETLVFILKTLLPLNLFLLIPSLILSKSKKNLLLESLILILNFIILPPFLAFTVYFLSLHTFKHIGSIEGSKNLFLNKKAWAATLIVSVPLIYLLDKNFINQGYVFTFPFYLFAALTLPHALLHESFCCQKKDLNRY